MTASSDAVVRRLRRGIAAHIPVIVGIDLRPVDTWIRPPSGELAGCA